MLAKLTCRCSRCRREKAPEVTRPEAGAKVRLATETDAGKRYLFDVPERCACGSQTVVLELMHGR